MQCALLALEKECAGIFHSTRCKLNAQANPLLQQHEPLHHLNLLLPRKGDVTQDQACVETPSSAGCYEQTLVRLYGLGSLLYALGIVQNGVCHSGTPLVHYCTPLSRLIWLTEGSDRVPPVCDSSTVLTATEATHSSGG